MAGNEIDYKKLAKALKKGLSKEKVRIAGLTETFTVEEAESMGLSIDEPERNWQGIHRVGGPEMTVEEIAEHTGGEVYTNSKGKKDIKYPKKKEVEVSHKGAYG